MVPPAPGRKKRHPAHPVKEVPGVFSPEASSEALVLSGRDARGRRTRAGHVREHGARAHRTRAGRARGRVRRRGAHAHRTRAGRARVRDVRVRHTRAYRAPLLPPYGREMSGHL